jgi:DNA-binding NarL/FixJ family response regulator
MSSHDALSLLTDRKQSVARYVAQGFSDKQIAAMMGLSPETIDHHIRGIKKIWRLDGSRNTRIQIAQRVFLEIEPVAS